MSVDEMLRSISARELNEWDEFFALEPWGSRIEFYRAGIVAAAILNVHRDPKKSKPIMPADFVPQVETTPRAQQSKKKVDPRVLKARFEVLYAGQIDRKQP